MYKEQFETEEIFSDDYQALLEAEAEEEVNSNPEEFEEYDRGFYLGTDPTNAEAFGRYVKGIDASVETETELPSNDEIYARELVKMNHRGRVNTGERLKHGQAYIHGNPLNDKRSKLRVNNQLDAQKQRAEQWDFESPELSAAAIKDLRKLASRSDINHLTYLLKIYEVTQKMRIRINNQLFALSGKKPSAKDTWTPDMPYAIEEYFWRRSEKSEAYIKYIIENIVQNHPLWSWLKKISGIGPLLAAELISTFTIQLEDEDREINVVNQKGQLEKMVVHIKAHGITSGGWERFAGYDPTSVKRKTLKEAKAELRAKELFEKKCKEMGIDPSEAEDAPTNKKPKRNYSAAAKTLLFKLTDCFMKNMTKTFGEGSLYCKLCNQFFKEELLRNELGLNKEYCEMRLASVGCPGPDTVSGKAYRKGKLSTGQVMLRARRRVAKIFLNHFHAVSMGLLFNKKPPVPYVIEHMGHEHQIFVPCWDAENLRVRDAKFETAADEPYWFAIPGAAEYDAACKQLAREKAALKKALKRDLTKAEEAPFVERRKILRENFKKLSGIESDA